MNKKLLLTSILLILIMVFVFVSCGQNEGSNESKDILDNNSNGQYTITFDTQGGSEVLTQNVEKGNKVTKPINPTKAGYTFVGWYVEDEEWSFICYPVTNDITIKAKWSINEYSISYQLNDGVVSSNNPTIYNVETETFTLNNPTKLGYTFTGWTGSNGSTAQKTVTITKGSSGDRTYTANWETTTEQAYSRSGNSIEFGLYPQTKVTDSTLISTLDTKAGTLPTSSNSQSWTSYGYYINGSVSNYMWYIDIEEGGEKYRGVYFTQYRPYYTIYTSSTDKSYQDDNGYKTNTVYWFKYEPIKWTIVEESNGWAILVCDIVIDSQQFDYDGSYSNNYKESTIRKWLNETFYNTAFNELQKSIIQITTVDNSASSTGSSSNSYACANTQDKVYLLSCKEATTYYTTDSSRQKKSSAYAQSQGCYESTSSSYLGNCYWWLRSPSYDNSYYAHDVDDDGDIRDSSVDDTGSGVVPALKIKL